MNNIGDMLSVDTTPVREAISHSHSLTRQDLFTVVSNIVPQDSSNSTGSNWRTLFDVQRRRFLEALLLRELFKNRIFLQLIQKTTDPNDRQDCTVLVSKLLSEDINNVWKNVTTREEFIHHISNLPFRISRI